MRGEAMRWWCWMLLKALQWLDFGIEESGIEESGIVEFG